MAVKTRRIAIVGAVALLIVVVYRAYFVLLDEAVKSTDPVNNDVVIEDASAIIEKLPENPKSYTSEFLDVGVGEDANGDLVGVANIEFPNGESIDIKLLQYAPEAPTVRVDGPLRDVYDGLAAAAENGDGSAGRWLYRALRSCIGSFSDSESMEASIAELRRTGTFKYPDGTVQDIGLGPRALGTEEVVREQFQKCHGISQTQIEGRNKWLKLAADAGDFLAMRDYATFVHGTDTNDGFELYKKTWENGHVSSASALAIFYRNGAPAELNGKPDMLYSYAFTLISNSVKKGVAGSGSNSGGPFVPLSANRIYSMDQLLSQKGAFLTPSQVEEAEKLAVRMLSENDACCLGNWLARRTDR